MTNPADLIILFVWTMYLVIVVFRKFFSDQRSHGSQTSSSKIEPSAPAHRYWQYKWTNTRMRSFFTRSTDRACADDVREYNCMRSIRQRSLYGKIAEPLRLQPIRNKERTARILIENWRKSIVGLVGLAQKNLDSANNHLEARNYNASVEAAFTSVENIARALIHCFGYKPDPSLGQEEPLRMLSGRFKGDERMEFEMAIDKIAVLIEKRTCSLSLSTHNVETTFFDEVKTKQILESASEITSLLNGIIASRFGVEIPELLTTTVKLDVAPKHIAYKESSRN